MAFVNLAMAANARNGNFSEVSAKEKIIDKIRGGAEKI